MATQHILVQFSPPIRIGRWSNSTVRIFFRWVGEKPATRKAERVAGLKVQLVGWNSRKPKVMVLPPENESSVPFKEIRDDFKSRNGACRNLLQHFFPTFMDVFAGMYPFFFVDKNHHLLSKMDHTELGVGATLENSVASCHLLLVWNMALVVFIYVKNRNSQTFSMMLELATNEGPWYEVDMETTRFLQPNKVTCCYQTKLS